MELEEEVEGEGKEDEGDGEDEYEEEDEEKVDREEGGGDRKGSKSSSNDFRPFILPKICSMNNFLPKLLEKVLNKLHEQFQIPNHIPLRLPGKNEKCYSEQMTDVGFYESVFIVGLRLPFTTLHCQLLDYLGMSVN